LINEHNTINKRDYNTPSFAQGKIRQNAGDVANEVQRRPYFWNGYADQQMNHINERMVLPREKKSSYANKFFIPGTTMRQRLELNELPSNK
jgi:hypothetical protein